MASEMVFTGYDSEGLAKYSGLTLHHEVLPVPYRTHDWSAFIGDPDLGMKIAYGSTREEAAQNYLDMYEVQG